MTRAFLLAAAWILAGATPALAQHAGHGTAATAPAADPSCPPEHAAMGHCKPATPAPAPARPATPSPSPATARPAATDPSCPPEHAAMGHCTPARPSAAKPVASHPHAGHGASAAPPAPSAINDPACPPEHAAMGHCTPGATTPLPPLARPTADPHAAHRARTPEPLATDPNCPPEHAAMGHCKPATQPAADPRDGHVMPGNAPTAAPPVAPPPQAAFSGPEHAAEAVFDPKLMAEKRTKHLIAEHGGYTGYMVLLDQLEVRVQDGRDGYAWEGDGWYGGDYDRLWLKSEGEGEFGGPLESAEVQALYSRALNPWFNLQTGVRYDIRPRPDRAHLVVGVQGLAPYWFEVDGALFLSDEGDLTARLEAEYDQRITNRLILQPRVELELGAQDVPELGAGSGLSSAEAGLRLRYEIKREFAPYIGVEYERRFGDTARFARAEGEKPGGWAFLIGLRSWF